MSGVKKFVSPLLVDSINNIVRSHNSLVDSQMKSWDESYQSASPLTKFRMSLFKPQFTHLNLVNSTLVVDLSNMPGIHCWRCYAEDGQFLLMEDQHLKNKGLIFLGMMEAANNEEVKRKIFSRDKDLPYTWIRSISSTIPVSVLENCSVFPYEYRPEGVSHFSVISPYGKYFLKLLYYCTL